MLILTFQCEAAHQKYNQLTHKCEELSGKDDKDSKDSKDVKDGKDGKDGKEGYEEEDDRDGGKHDDEKKHY